jgi:hypothetical protein
VLFLSLAACTAGAEDWEELMPETTAPTQRIAGPVVHLDLEGGVWVIREADGTRYNPTNLPETYRTEGMRVEADVIPRDDAPSIAMVGPIVDIVRIRRSAREDAEGTEGTKGPTSDAVEGGS